ncbi:hypothetical protein [Mycolicibacterium sp.]|uniref:hypothetical protein n=1 Tax=Mycolicibacterium sp. TaxID=2320850 RepID=UPI0025E33CC1|nr:hypothetical protein [Mycolicibacterium sp.]MCB9409237.1 hypothetical protein [Mycolicibacterium sp.]
MTQLQVPDAAQLRDLAVFAQRALRLDDGAVIRLRLRNDGLIGAWVSTGLDVLAARVVVGSLAPADVTCSAEALLRGLESADESGRIDPGYPMDSAWRGALPPETGFNHIDDVPAAIVADVARRGSELAREHAGPQGPPTSLLNQDVLQVSSPADAVAVPMRCVMALTAMGFMPGAEAEVIRVRARPGWLRIDARFGSVFRRLGDPLVMLG